MQHIKTLSLAALLSVPLTAQQGAGDISISSGNVSFDVVFNSRSLVYEAASGTAWFKADPGGDAAGVLFSTAWAYRIDNQTRETILNQGGSNNPTFSNLGASGTGTWTDVDGLGLISAHVEYTAIPTSGISGAVTGRMTITNISSNPITLNLFHLADIDLCGSAFNTNTITPGDDGHQRVTGSCQEIAEHFAVCADRWEVGSYTDVPTGSGNIDLYTQLEDSAITNLRNDTAPFGPYDIRSAFQWSDQVIAAGASRTYIVGLAHNDRGCAAGSLPYGTGVAGGNGVPQISLAAPALIGTTLQTQIQNGPANFTGALLLGLNRADVSLGDLRLLVGTPNAVFPFTTNGSGSATSSLNIPNLPGLCGFEFEEQAFFLGDTSSQSTTGLPVTHSAGLCFTVGMY